MLIYSHKLESYILNKIFPIILLDNNKYSIKGSFRRKIPYVTDIDVVNNVYPEINAENIHENIIKLIDKVSLNKNLIIIYFTCGRDDRFQIKTGTDEEINKISKLLPENEQDEILQIMSKYSSDNEKKSYLINNIFKEYHKLRWDVDNIKNNTLSLPGGNTLKFTEIIKMNKEILIKYAVRLNHNEMLGIDVAIYYDEFDSTTNYANVAAKHLKNTITNKEYYFILFQFRLFFRKNYNILKELENIIEKKFGLNKQLMVRIEMYQLLFKTKKLNIEIASGIVIEIIKDTMILPNFKTEILNNIKLIALNNTPEFKMNAWNILLGELHDEINSYTNTEAKNYYFKYLKMIPGSSKSNYLIE